MRGFVTAGFCLISLWFINYAIPEVRKMISEMFKQQRFEQGLAQGIELGREQGIELGHRRGRQDQQKAWEDWNGRRETAQANGQPFTEPPPTLDRAANGHQ